MVGSNHSGRRGSTRVNAVERHQVDALCQLPGEAVGKGLHIVQLNALSGIEKLVRDAAAVFHLERYGRDGADSRAALRLRSVLRDYIDLAVQGERELLEPVKRERSGRAQLRQRALALGLVDEFRNQLLGKEAAFTQDICHS